MLHEKQLQERLPSGTINNNITNNNINDDITNNNITRSEPVGYIFY